MMSWIIRHNNAAVVTWLAGFEKIHVSTVNMGYIFIGMFEMRSLWIGGEGD